MPVAELTDVTEEDLERELRKRKAACWFEADRPVTVMLPCRNCWRHLAVSLCWLEKRAQSVPLRLVTADQVSDDGVTDAVLCHLGKDFEKRGSDIEYTFLGQVRDWGAGKPRTQETMNRNMCHIRKVLADAVETPFAMFLDSDVCVPVGGVRAMLEALRQDESLGLVGIPYARRLDHIQGGLTMIRTEILKGLDFRADGCWCRWLTKEVQRMGHGVKHLEGWYALHLRDEVGLLSSGGSTCSPPLTPTPAHRGPPPATGSAATPAR